MKKITFLLSLLVSATLFFSCGIIPEEKKTADGYDWTEVWEAVQNSTKQTNEESSSVITTTSDHSSVEEKAEEETKEKTEENTEWKQFLIDYENWVDDYVTFMKKYSADPTNLSLLSDYAKMSAKLIEWSSDASKIESDLSVDDLVEYQQTMARITKKLSEISY